MSLIGNLWLETKIRMRHSFLPQLFYTIYRACAPHQSSEQNLALPGLLSQRGASHLLGAVRPGNDELKNDELTFWET